MPPQPDNHTANAMKKKQLIKLTRDIPDELIRQQVEYGGLSVTDYFLMETQGGYLVCHWGRDGRQYASMDDDEANNFAVAQYLIRHGTPIYKLDSEIPKPEINASLDNMKDNV